MPRFQYWLNGEAIDRESLAKLVRPLPILSFVESFQRQPSQNEICPYCNTTAESVQRIRASGLPSLLHGF